MSDLLHSKFGDDWKIKFNVDDYYYLLEDSLEDEEDSH